MAHQRKVIRKAIANALVTAATAAEGRVYASRAIPLRRLDLPAIAVYTLTEEVTEDSAATAPRELERQLSVVIECWAAAAQYQLIDDVLDDLAEEVEAAMHADPYFGDACGDSILSSTEIELDDSGDRLLGLARLTYAVTYRQLAPAAQDLDDWRTAEIDYSLAGEQDDEDDQAHDELVL